MKRFLVPCVIAAALGGCSAYEDGVTGGNVDGMAAFAHMKMMAGRYKVEMPETPGQFGSIVYAVTAGGHVLEEKLFEGTDHEMVSLYYLEGRDLALVHYCSAGNRPHMRLDRIKSTLDDLYFEWDGTATDIDPAKDGHIHHGRIHFTDADTIDCTWVFWQDGKESHVANFKLSTKPEFFTPMQ